MVTKYLIEYDSGDNFKIYILLGDTRFHIAINDQPYCVFYYRMAPQLIRTIEVTRDIQSVNQIDHRSVYPSPWPLLQQEAGYLVFSNDVPRQFSPGTLIRYWFRSLTLFKRFNNFKVM